MDAGGFGVFALARVGRGAPRRRSGCPPPGLARDSTSSRTWPVCAGGPAWPGPTSIVRPPPRRLPRPSIRDRRGLGWIRRRRGRQHRPPSTRLDATVRLDPNGGSPVALWRTKTTARAFGSPTRVRRELAPAHRPPRQLAFGRPHVLLRHHADLLRQRASPISGTRTRRSRADILARHMRQRGEDVFFLTGTDEHGEPVAQAAEREGVTPRELADRNAPRFRDAVPRINATNDFFIRTSRPASTSARVQEVLQRVHDNGHVYEGTYEGCYCPRCADFKTEPRSSTATRCPIHQIVLERENEDNWFFQLSAFQEPLEQLYAEQPDFVLAAQPLQRGAVVHQAAACSDVSLTRAQMRGACRCRGTRARSSTSGSTLSSTTTRRSRTRARARTSPTASGRPRAPDRQGHPQVPRRLLAGDADGRRDRGAGAASSSTASC